MTQHSHAHGHGHEHALHEHKHAHEHKESKEPKKKADKIHVLHHPREGAMAVIVLEKKDGKVKCTPEADDAGFPKRNDKHEHGVWKTVRGDDGIERQQLVDGTFEEEGWFDENLLEDVKK